MQARISSRGGNGMLWGTVIASFLIFLVFERRIFMRYVDDTSMQFIVVGVLFAAALLSIFGGRALSTRWLAMAVFTSAIVLAMAWFVMFFNLAAVERDYNMSSMAWALYVQLVLLTLQIAVLPTLLIEWTRRCRIADTTRTGTEATMSTISLIAGGAMAAVAGACSFMADHWVVLLACIYSTVTAFIIMLSLGRHVVESIANNITNDAGASDANLFFRDAMITFSIGILGYAMMARDSFYFSTLFYTGTSVAIFGITYAIAAHVRKRPGALAVLEGNLIALFIGALLLFIYLYMGGMQVPLNSGLPEFIIGFALGYFWTRVMHVGEGTSYPKAFARIPRRGLGLDATGKFVAFLFLFLLGVSVAFSINAVDPETIQYVYPAAIGIAATCMLLWTISAVKYKH
jgi:hypothetical protein